MNERESDGTLRFALSTGRRGPFFYRVLFASTLLLGTLLSHGSELRAGGAIRPIDRLQSEARGLYVLWADGRADSVDLLNLPFVRGGQVVAQWADIEPAPGRYDFSGIDAAVTKLTRAGRWTTLQINGNLKPRWLFESVPYVRRQLHQQVRDREGTLMFWHSSFRSAHLAMLSALAAHLGAGRDHAKLLGIRLNFNAIGTEQTNVPPEFRAPDQWVVPPAADRTALVPFTPAVHEQYEEEVLSAYRRLFAGFTTVFVRNNISDELRAKFDADFRAGRLAWFHTSSEAEPRGAAIERQYATFFDYCRSGETVGYAEPWASAWGEHGGMTDPRWCSPAQWNYWTLLLNLHCGVSFVGEYYANLHFASTGEHRGGSVTAGAAAAREFMAAYEWGGEYVGRHNRPFETPGAWVAFRANDRVKAENARTAEAGRTLRRFTGDYTWLAERLPDDGSVGVGPVGPPEERYGAFARSFPAGSRAHIRFNDGFVDSVHSDAVVRVIFLDDHQGAGPQIAVGGVRIGALDLHASGRWQVANFRVAADALKGANPGWHVELAAGEHPVIVHMIELRRSR